MRVYLQFCLIAFLSLSVFSANKYFVILNSPINLSSVSGFQTYSSAKNAFSKQSAIKTKAFTMEGVKGIKHFTTYGKVSQSIISLANGNVPDTDSSPKYVYMIKIDEDMVEEFKETIKELDDFVHFQPNFRYRAFASPTTETNYVVNQMADMELMKFNEVWDYSNGSGARVAVIDTGIFPNHKEFCDSNGIFDEASQIMDVSTCSALDAPFDFIDGGSVTNEMSNIGYSAVSGADYEDIDNAPFDKDGHGSHVSGIIGARVNDALVTGTAYNSTIIPIRALAPYVINGISDSIGQTDWLVNAVNYAVTNNADIINMSLGGVFPDSTEDLLFQMACQNAFDEGVLLIAAAGNSLVNIDSEKVAPAYYSTVMSVSSVSNDGNFASSYSNYGNTLDVAAVGTDVVNVGISNTTSLSSLTGTSMATPYVSGLAALIVSYYANLPTPITLTPTELRNLIRRTATSPTNITLALGYGIIDAQNAFIVADAIDSSSVDGYEFPAYLEEFLCYPNPLYRSESAVTGCRVYQNNNGTAEYSVFSRRGELVTTGQLTFVPGEISFNWNGNDRSGKRLPNGVYQIIIRLTDTDNSEISVKKHMITLL